MVQGKLNVYISFVCTLFFLFVAPQISAQRKLNHETVISHSVHSRLAPSKNLSLLNQSSPEKESLKNLRGISIVVEQVKPNVQQIITQEQARAIVETRLKTNGLLVLNKTQVMHTQNAGYLYLKLKILKIGNTNQYSYSWQLQLLQRVSLDRDSSFRILAPTWNRDNMGYANERVAASDLRIAIKEIVDMFSNDYREANQ